MHDSSANQNHRPDYTIVIPAYNEELYLPATLAAIKSAMGQAAKQGWRGELVVVDNNSRDGTSAVARELGAHVVFEPYNQIARARNSGARVATGAFLVFVDADTLISGNLLCDALQRMRSGGCCGGGAVVRFDDHDSAIARQFLRLWTWLSIKRRLAAGCFVFARREMFDEIGGFSEQVYASEEIWFSRNADRWGREHQQRFCIITETAVLSSGRKIEWFTTPQQLLLLLMMVFFPFFVRFRSLCGFWYRRPGK